MTKEKAAKKPAKEKAPKKEKAVKTETVADEAAPVASKFTLEDNVPLPARIRAGGVSPYPFASMQVGQSFLVQADIDPDLYTSDEEFGKALVEEFRVLANRLSGATRRFTKTHEGYKFAVRTTSDGVRVWRVEA